MNVYLYVLNTLADWEIAYITAELNSGRFLDRSKPPVRIITVGNSLEPIKTMGGMTLAPDEKIDQVVFQPGDLLILPGGETWFEEENKKVIDIAANLDSSVTIAAICGATMALAAKGLLDRRPHTSNDPSYLKMTCPGYKGENYYLKQPVVVDNNLITATGIAPLEFSYEVFKNINVMKPETLEAWYGLFATKEEKYFFALMESLDT